MSRQRFIALLVAAVLAISGALYLSTERSPPRDPRGGALLPALAGEMNTVSAVSVRRASATPTATMHLKDGRWTVAERGDYPADVPKLRKLLLALSDAKIVEEKTSNPASFPLIGVEDPSAPGATGAEVGFTARDGAHAVIVGKPVGGGNFVRRKGENSSYSVEPGIPFETEPRFWIESKLFDAAPANIQSIEVKPAAGAAYTLRRAAPAAPAATPAGGATPAPGSTASGAAPVAGGTAAADVFTLEGVPPGRKPADSAMLAPSPTLLSGLNVDDVAPVGDIDFSKPAVATVTLSDGNVIKISGAANGDKHWIRLQAGKDAPLNARADGRAFEIAGYQFDAIFRPVEQLLVPKPPPPAPAKTPPKKNPVPSP
ncbi:MAG: DUF4340 domain-containing protein [Steroidobacteraceae bacterium]